MRSLPVDSIAARKLLGRIAMTTNRQLQLALQRHSSGFAVRSDGRIGNRQRAQLRRFVAARGLSPTEGELTQAIEEACERYHAGDNRLFVCAEAPCAGAFGFDVGDESLARIAATTGVAVTRTGCQGHCKQAPLLTLRVGQECQRFAHLVTEDDRNAVFDFARRAAEARSFLVPENAAAMLRFDPAHGHEETNATLGPMRFLVGRFRGEGRYVRDGYAFTKELVGSYEAGGRFVSLRIQASYPLPEGGTDVHRAFVMVGADNRQGQLTGRAFTDGGEVHDYIVERRASALEFNDRPPDHSRSWKRVRKILRPLDDGFEEELAVDAGDGLAPYYTVRMRRSASV